MDSKNIHLYFQMVIFSFGNMGSYRLNSSTNNSTLEMINVHEFLSIYLFANINENALTLDEKTIILNKLETLINNLLQNSQLLLDYYSIEIFREKGNFLFII